MQTSVMVLTEQNREPIIKAYTQNIQEVGCGICKKKGAEVFWTAPKGSWVHKKCLREVQPAESFLYKAINLNFRENMYRIIAHGKAVEAVESKLEGKTIKQYLDEKGISALTTLFNTVGTRAVIIYRESVDAEFPAARL